MNNDKKSLSVVSLAAFFLLIVSLITIAVLMWSGSNYSNDDFVKNKTQTKSINELNIPLRDDQENTKEGILNKAIVTKVGHLANKNRRLLHNEVALAYPRSQGDIKKLEKLSDSIDLNSNSPAKNPLIRAVSIDDKLSARDRVKLLQEVEGDHLNDDIIREIFREIDSGQIPNHLIQVEWHWIVDELISTLRDSGADPILITEELNKLFVNDDNNIVIRDYALQHMGHLYSEGGHIDLIRNAQQQALVMRDDMIAGTALIGSVRNDPDQDDLLNANQILHDSSYNIQSRVSALLVLNELASQDVADVAYKLANDKSNPDFLRLSAVSVLTDYPEYSANVMEFAFDADVRISNLV